MNFTFLCYSNSGLHNILPFFTWNNPLLLLLSFTLFCNLKSCFLHFLFIWHFVLSATQIKKEREWNLLSPWFSRAIPIILFLLQRGILTRTNVYVFTKPLCLFNTLKAQIFFSISCNLASTWKNEYFQMLYFHIMHILIYMYIDLFIH